MPVGKIISSTVKKNRDGDKKVLLMEVEITDPDDLQDVELMRMAGVDSNPPANSLCFIVQSGESWKIAVAVNDNIESAAGPGEHEIYSSDGGVKKASAYFKSDGTLILNFGNDNAVRFSELETAFNQLKADHDDLVTKFLAHIHTTTATIGLGPAVGVISPTIITDDPSTADIAPAKVESINVP
ncbi:MAG: hypothetical protein ACTSPB_07815 [Candidatus Thorarchaeota archaeon]